MPERRKRHNCYQIALNLQTVRAVARLQNKTRQVSSAEGASRKGGVWGHAPQKILNSRGSEMLF